MLHCHQHGSHIFRFDIHEGISGCSNKSYEEDTYVKLDRFILKFFVKYRHFRLVKCIDKIIKIVIIEMTRSWYDNTWRKYAEVSVII